MFSDMLTKLSLIPLCLFPDGKTTPEKRMFLMTCSHFQRNWREATTLPCSQLWAGVPWVTAAGPWMVALMWGWGQDLTLLRAGLAQGRGWGSVCVTNSSCGSPAWPAPWAQPSLCHLEHLRKSLWTRRYESCLDPVSGSGNHNMEIRLCFRSHGWALREQQPAWAVCSGLHQPCLGHRHHQSHPHPGLSACASLYCHL